MSPSKDIKEEPEDSKTVKTEKRKKSDSSGKSDKDAPSSKQVKVKLEAKEKEVDPASNIYQEVLDMEQKESETRSAVKDHDLWVETCGELRLMMKDIFDLKMKKSPATDITEKRIQASLLFVTLKKLNRLEKLRIKMCRDMTNQSKQGVDSFNLQLQNLLYEVLHLRKEVDKCINFKSADESLSLVSEATFFEEAPTDIARPEVTKQDDHSLRLARLQWELTCRKELGEDSTKRESERDDLETNIRQREDKLRELQPQLSAILATTKPVQDYLGLPLDYRREQTSLARLLPDPLYILYTQTHAYSQACDPLLEVKVIGDKEEAKRFKEESSKLDVDDDDSQGDEQDSVDPDIELVDNKVRRGGKPKVTNEDKKTRILAVHPLSVMLTVGTKKSEDKISLTMSYLPGLDVVVVNPQLMLVDTNKTGGEVLQSATVLSCLYPEDCGTRSPNPINEHQLAALGLTESLTSLLAGTLLPYRWAQMLSGLDFLSSNSDEIKSQDEMKHNSSFSRLHLQTTLDLLRTRLVARIDLQSQLSGLSRSKPVLSDLLPPSVTLPTRFQAKLKSWSSLDWETYSGSEFTKHLIQQRVVDENDFLFKAQCIREKACLTALVAIKPNYPKEVPVFCLSLSLGDKVETLDISEGIRQVEVEMNTGWEDQLGCDDIIRSGLLVQMLHRLLILLDILLEVRDEEKFSKSQVFHSGVSGRMRNLPLVYNKDMQAFQCR